MQSTSGDKSLSYKRLCVVGLGNLIEWYDWNIYAVFSSALALSFFGRSGGVQSLLEVLVVFAIGFIFRPVGGFFLSRLADQYGRRTGMMVAVGMMAGGSLIIGLAPTFAQAGYFSSACLIAARILQGLSAGGEHATTATYLTEIAPPGRRGLVSSVTFISDTIGILAALLVSIVIRSVMPLDAVNLYGWRIAYVIGGILGIVAYYLWKPMAETESFEVTKDKKVGAFDFVIKYPKQFAQVIGLTLGPVIWYIMFAIYLPSYVIASNEAAAKEVNLINIFVMILFIFILPLFGMLADKIGHKTNVTIFCGLGTFLAVPLFLAVDNTAMNLLVIMLVAVTAFAMYAAVSPTLTTVLFPPEVRATGVGFPYAFGLALFGGTAPLLYDFLNTTGHRELFGWYIALLCAIAFVTCLTLPRTLVDEPDMRELDRLSRD